MISDYVKQKLPNMYTIIHTQRTWKCIVKLLVFFFDILTVRSLLVIKKEDAA